MADICHDCPRRADCMLTDAIRTPERCTYHQLAIEAEAAAARMAAARVDLAMINRVIGAIATETGQTPRQVRERLHKGGIRR